MPAASNPDGPCAPRRPTVFVDANPLRDRHISGIGRFSARAALALSKWADVRFFTGRQELVPPRALGWDADQDLARWAKHVWRGRRRRLTDVPAGAIGLYPCLRSEVRLFPIEVSVLYDFTQLIVPHTHTERARGLFSVLFGKTLLRSDAAIAISEATKFDASWLCDFEPDRIRVASPGPSLCVERHLNDDPIERRSDVGLIVSTVEPRKNAGFVIDWFRSTDVLPPGAELWWAGPTGWLTKRQQVRGIEGRNGRRLKFLGPVSDAELCRLYQTAGWTLYPSLYEGFGLPVLDSLRHGAPVLVSGNSALWEFRDIPGVSFLDPLDARSVDAAYREMIASGGPAAVAPLDRLDSRYHWEGVAQAILDAGRPEAAIRHRPQVCAA